MILHLRFLVFAGCFLFSAAGARGDLVVDLVGIPGHSIVTLHASGSNVIGSPIIANSLPFEGNFLGPGSMVANGSFTASTLMMSNGTTDALFGSFEVDQANDSLILKSNTGILFSAGETISVSGDGVTDLAAIGLTFDDFVPGTYSFFETSRGTITLNIASVPEPSAFLALGGMSSLVLIWYVCRAVL